MRIGGCIVLMLAVGLNGCSEPHQTSPVIPSRETAVSIDTCFVPGPQDCALVIADVIGEAQRTIDVQAYNFTEPRIAAAIVAAKRRGVAVRVVLDKTAPHERGEMADSVAAAGVPVWIDYKPHIAHNKVMVIDGSAVVGGSFNYSTNADEHNAENVTIIRDQVTAAAFERNFESRLSVSRFYSRS